jgi:L-fuculose-phosphate aldolase
VLDVPAARPALVAAAQRLEAAVLDADGAVVEGHRRPTSEWQLHVAVMARRPTVGAIVHTHSPEATAAAVQRQAVPPVHYVAARFSDAGDPPGLPCAPYATYGSRALAEGVADVLGDHGRAALMANHGAVVVADDLDAAVALAIDVEWFCGVWRRAVALGDPVPLADEEIVRVAGRFATYGQPDQGADRAD